MGYRIKLLDLQLGSRFNPACKLLFSLRDCSIFIDFPELYYMVIRLLQYRVSLKAKDDAGGYPLLQNNDWLYY
jgi:hypothetical protein